MKKEYLCIYLPMWATDLLKRNQNKLQLSPNPESRRTAPKETSLHCAESKSSAAAKATALADANTSQRLTPAAKISRENIAHDLGQPKSLVAKISAAPPLLLFAKTANQIVVARFCRKAQMTGVKTGMLLSMARILASSDNTEPLSLPFSAEYTFRSLCLLALWTKRFSPLVALDEDILAAYKEKKLAIVSPLYDGLILDISGTQRVHHGNQALVQKIQEYFKRMSIEARIGIAPTVGAAWAISRFSRQNPCILDADVKLAEALSAFPISALRLPAKTIAAVKQIGLEKISDLLKLPRDSLATRFGSLVLKRLDQAMGVQEEALCFIKEKESFEAQRQFDIPLSNHDTLKSITLSLFRQVIQQLHNCGKKASNFVIALEKLDQQREVILSQKEVSLYHASTNMQHINSVLQPILESIKAAGGVRSIKVSARMTAQEQQEQEVMFVRQENNEKENKRAVGELLNHLLIRLGEENLSRVFFEGSWVPEKSFSYRSLRADDQTQVSDHVSSERPPYMFNPPQSMDAIALLPDSPPARISWRGEKLKVLKGLGPERISDEWWHSSIEESSASQARDYFKLQDENGRWLWVYRELTTSNWFVHGLWV